MTFPQRGNNFRTLQQFDAEPILRDWMLFQVDADRRIAEARTLTAPDRTEEVRLQRAYERIRDQTARDRRKWRKLDEPKP